MTPDQRLAQIVHALQQAGIDILVMGGHAVRYYGIDRNTIDFDLVTSVATAEELRSKLPEAFNSPNLREQGVWRANDFARFEIGRLPDGRQELLEFWLRNHLLGDFQTLNARAEIGFYGGSEIPFLSLPDLLKSKETERETDWSDIALLEEIQDGRNFAALQKDPRLVSVFVTNLRSRRGMDQAIDAGLPNDPALIRETIAACTHPAAFAFWIALAPSTSSSIVIPMIEPTTLASLRSATFGTAKHFALIEICRRAYKRRAIELDRADKQAKLSQGR